MTDLADDHASAALHHAVLAFADAAEHTAELEDLARLLVESRKAKADLAEIERTLEREIGSRMPTKRLVVEHLGTLERHQDRSWRNWQSDDLLRMVLDSDRRPKNETTGEVESDLDVLRHVYGLKGYNASRTALRERGVDPEEYAEYEDRGWKVQVR